MFLVQLLDPKWCFISITGTHVEPEDDPAGSRTERLHSVSGLYVLNVLGIILVYNYG